MSQVISQGFRTLYEILDVGSIKPGGSGKMDNGFVYSASVKFRSQNVIMRDDPRVGVQELETIVEFKIPCDSEDEAIKVSEAIRKIRNDKSSFIISADLPVMFQDGRKKDVFNVVSFDKGMDSIKSLQSFFKSSQAVKA